MKRSLRQLIAAAALVVVAQWGAPLQAARIDGKQVQATPPTPPTAEAPLNLNTATAETLQLLPGVGPAMAARILEYRETNGAFEKIEELMNIRGIGEKTFLKLKPLVVVPPGLSFVDGRR